MGTNESNIKNAKALTDIPTNKKKQEIKTKVKKKAKQITSHNMSIQTDTEDKIESVNVMKLVKSQRKAKVMPPIKPSKLIIKMEKRAMERKEKREKLIELKKQKEQKYK